MTAKNPPERHAPESRRPPATGPQRDAAMMGILSTLLQVIRSLAENQPSLGLTQHLENFQQHYDVLNPPAETPQEQRDREERQKHEKEREEREKAQARQRAHA